MLSVAEGGGVLFRVSLLSSDRLGSVFTVASPKVNAIRWMVVSSEWTAVLEGGASKTGTDVLLLCPSPKR